MNLYIDTTQDNGNGYKYGEDKYTNPKDTILQIEPEIKGKTPVLGKIESAEFSNITILAKNMLFLGEVADPAESAFVSYGGLQMPDQKIINNISLRSDQNINSYLIAMASSKIKEVIDEPLVNLLTKKQINELEFGPQYIYRPIKMVDNNDYIMSSMFRSALSVFPSFTNPLYYVTSFKIPQLFDLLGIEYNKTPFTNVDDTLFGAYFNIPVNTMRNDFEPLQITLPGSLDQIPTNWYNLRVWSRLNVIPEHTIPDPEDPSRTIIVPEQTKLKINSETLCSSANNGTPLTNVFVSNYRYGDNMDYDSSLNMDFIPLIKYSFLPDWEPGVGAANYFYNICTVTLNFPDNKSIINSGLLVLDDMDIEYSLKLYTLLDKFYVTVCLIGSTNIINFGLPANTQQFLESFCGLKEVKFLGDYGFDKDGRATTEPQQPNTEAGQTWSDLPPLHIDAGSLLCFWPKDMVNGGSLRWRSSWESTPPSIGRISFGVSNTIMTNPSKQNILKGITLRDVLNVLNYHSCGKLTITANMGVIDVNCFEYKVMNLKSPASIVTLDGDTAQHYKISPMHILATKDLNYLGGSSLAYTLVDTDMIDNCRKWLNNIGDWLYILYPNVWDTNIWYGVRWLTRFESETTYTYSDNTSKLSPAKTVDICKAPYCIFYIQQMCRGVYGFIIRSDVGAWNNNLSSDLNYAYEIEANINPSHLPLINNCYVLDYLLRDFVGLYAEPIFLLCVITNYNYKKGKATLKVLSKYPLFLYIEDQN